MNKESTAQKLRTLLEEKNMQFGATPDGRDWCIKALHPSDPLTEVRGVPDWQAQPTTLLNWQAQTSIKAQAAATGTWSCDMCVMPDPLAFAWVSTTDTTGTTVTNIVNQQLGATITAAGSALTTNAMAWRIAYMSVTVYQDGPALANQGTVVASQYPMPPTQVVQGASMTTTAGSAGKVLGRQCVKYASVSAPDYARLRTMPNAYFGNSRDGVYMPIKLDPNHVAWRAARDMVHDATAFSGTGPNYTIPTGTSAPSAGFPYAAAGIVPAYYDTGAAEWKGTLLCGPISTNVGGICFANLDVTTGLSVVTRVGIEVQAYPGSAWGPYLKLAPQTDPVALNTYYAIARELKDAYPADYNDWAKLWNVIKKAASAVAPILPAFGPVGMAIHGAGSAVGSVIDGLTTALEKKPREMAKDTPPAAAVERAREVAHYAARAPLQAPKKKPKVKFPKRKK